MSETVFYIFLCAISFFLGLKLGNVAGYEEGLDEADRAWRKLEEKKMKLNKAHEAYFGTAKMKAKVKKVEEDG